MGALEIAGYALLGGVAGLLAGLLGIGGGLVIVPGLWWLFQEAGLPVARLTQLAVGTSLASIVFTAAISAAGHHRRGAVHWSAALRLAPGLVLGAVLGAILADQLSSAELRRFFAAFTLLVAWQLLVGLPAPLRSRLLRGRDESGMCMPQGTGLAAAGMVMGMVSALVGIGGGTLVTPFLLWCGLGLRRAIATSAACGLPIAVAGAGAYLVTGWSEAALPGGSSGYLYWPALLVLVPASMAAAPLGVHLAHRLPLPWLRRGFALVLLAVGLSLW